MNGQQQDLRPQGDAIIIPGNYRKQITTTTDDFALIRQAANQGRLISLKLVWSFRFWTWMYKYTWWY